MGNRLYVGNLSFNTSEETLRECFGEVGEVTDVHIVSDRETGRSRGFAFVTMGTSEAAANAISQMDGATLDGRALREHEQEGRDADRPRGQVREARRAQEPQGERLTRDVAPGLRRDDGPDVAVVPAKAGSHPPA